VRSVKSIPARGHEGRANCSAITFGVLERTVARAIPQRTRVRSNRSSVEIPQSSVNAPGLSARTRHASIIGSQDWYRIDFSSASRTLRKPVWRRDESVRPDCRGLLDFPLVTTANGSVLSTDSEASISDRSPGMLFRLRYSPFLAQIVIVRRCNLSCGYCSEYDKVSDPIPAEILEQRLRKLKSLGTFGISLTGGEPTLHPELPGLIRRCRELGFFRTGMISNGLLLRPQLIERLNEAGLQEMQISIDGVRANDTTQKVLANLRKRLEWLRDHARFHVIVSGVIGASPPREAKEVIAFAEKMGFTPRVLLVHDDHGQLNLNREEVAVFEDIIGKLPRSLREFSSYRKRLVHDGAAPFKCRAGSRYLYVDEFGRVNWCSQTRDTWSKALMDYTPDDLRHQFFTYKSCHATCTVGCARSASQFDNWRAQPGFSS
jgi:MoaA/NifB/PqqE/SkfB family radical SAM enzyme